jgi:PglZ domain.
LVEFEFTGVVWASRAQAATGPTIAAWLEGHGLRFTGGAAANKRLTSGASDSKLARWLARIIDRELRELPEPVRETDITAMLGGDPGSSVIDLLLDPDRAFHAWADDAGDVLDRVRDRFGLKIGVEMLPDAVADAVAADLALTEAWDAFGCAADFPFEARLPVGDAKRADVVRFVRRDLLARGDAGPAFLRRVAPQEVSFTQLTEWSANRSGSPAALPRLSFARYLLAIERVQHAADSGWRESVAPLEPGGSQVDVPAVPGVPTTSWHGLERLRSLVVGAKAATDFVPNASASQLVQGYLDGWWRIDDDYLTFLREADRHPALTPLRAVADEAYAAFLEASAHRWTDMLEAGSPWDAGVPSIRVVARNVWRSGKGPRATLVIDAVRWDVAKAIEARIGPTCRVEPALATIPSTTPFGMTAVLPLGASPDAIAGTNGVALTFDGHEVSAREGRKTFLKAWFNGDGRTVEFLELDQVIQGVAIPKADHIVIFNYALDQTGHALATAATLPTEVEAHVARLALAIQQLHRAKIRRVDLVTDHGFLYVNPAQIDSLGRPKVAAANVWNRGPRYALLKPDAPAPDLVRIEAPMVPGTFVGLPRGIRTLDKAHVYLHGGVSLQECVIPHLISESADIPAVLKVEVTPSSSQLSGGTVAVLVRPMTGDQQLTLSAPLRLRLRLWLEAEPEAGWRVEVSDPLELEVRSDSPELRQALYLRDETSLRAGTKVLLRARDLDTMADLSESVLTLIVDWG